MILDKSVEHVQQNHVYFNKVGQGRGKSVEHVQHFLY